MKINLYENLEKIDFNRNLQVNTIDFSRFNNTIGELEVKKFITFMTENFPIQNLKLFCNNINSLDIKYLKTKLIYKNAGGYYDIDQNDIFIRKEDIQDCIWHELKHMSSSYVDKENKVSFSGFMVETENYFIGIGLNEGYTQTLAQRYFVPDYALHSYEALIDFSLAIEKIVGKEEMENFYYNANLLGLINKLSLYQNKENVYKIIENIDYIHDGLYKKKLFFNKKIIDTISETETLLISSYKNKLDKENSFNEDKISDFIGNLPGTIIYKSKEYNIPLVKTMEKFIK